MTQTLSLRQYSVTVPDTCKSPSAAEVVTEARRVYSVDDLHTASYAVDTREDIAPSHAGMARLS